MPYTLTQSGPNARQGSEIYTAGGFDYNIQAKYGTSKYLRCRKARPCKCRARAKIVDEEFFFMKGAGEHVCQYSEFKFKFHSGE